MKKTMLTLCSLCCAALFAADADFTADFQKGDGEIYSAKIGEKPVKIDGGRSVVFQLKPEYFSADSGTVSFRFRPLGWGHQTKAEGKGHFVPFFAIDGGKGSSWTLVSFFTWSANGNIKIQAQARGANNSGTNYDQHFAPADSMNPDSWNRIVFTWNTESFAVWINGKQVSRAVYKNPGSKKLNPKWKMWICPRQFWTGALTPAYELADVSISKKVLTADEIAALK